MFTDNSKQICVYSVNNLMTTSGGNCSTPTPHASTTTTRVNRKLSGIGHTTATSFLSLSCRYTASYFQLDYFKSLVASVVATTLPEMACLLVAVS